MRRNRLHIGVLVKAYLAAGVIGVSSLGAFAAPVFAAKRQRLEKQSQQERQSQQEKQSQQENQFRKERQFPPI